MASPLLLEKECSPKCRSGKHVDKIIAQIPSVSLVEFQAYSSLCYNWYQNFDLLGRTALHIAASCGKTNILEWLLDEKKVDLSAKDGESGYTALHRAVFYGQIAAAKILIQYDSDLKESDNEGLTSLDLAVYDRPFYITYSINEPNEVSTWGENINTILGHPTTNKRVNPDVVTEFRKLGLSIKQVLVRKYHSVFLTQNGLVYTCGRAEGGRLGHGNHHTVLVPQLVNSISGQACEQIAAGADHTLFRMQGGTVFSCGLNTHHQLGHQPDIESCLSPKSIKIYGKASKKKSICGICAGQFHSVVWTHDEIYMVGLNAGQLGHPKGDKYVQEMQPIPSLKSVAAGLLAVTCSDAATACLTAKGDVIVLHEYLCRRIAVRLSAIEQIVVTGGTLDHHTGVNLLMEKGGRELILVLRSKWGKLYVWRGSGSSVKRCRWKGKQQLTISDVAVNDSNLIVTTDKGQAYLGKLSPNKENHDVLESHKDNFRDGGDLAKQPRLLDRMLKEEVEEVVATRLPRIHRALTIASDRKGWNFAVIQALPNCILSKFPSVSSSAMHENFGRLLMEADENDIVHDAVIQVENRTWPVHRYIIGMRSHFFHQVFHKSVTEGDSTIPVYKVDDITRDLMEQIIQFMYTDTCDFLTPGFKLKSDNLTNNRGKERDRQNNGCEEEENFSDLYRKETSAFAVRQSRKKNEKNKSYEKKAANKEESINQSFKMFHEAAQKLGVKNLIKRLNQVKCKEGIVTCTTPQPSDRSRLCFDRQKFPELCDLTIVTEDGKEIQCHKCVLISRLEYFYSMFATGWMESTRNSRLMLPAPGEALEILIDFLYTDNASQVTDCSNEKLLYEVLVVSDQLLAWRLKELCEVALTNIMSFKNVGELLEFSGVYHANQLKESCQQFICLNISAILEARILEVLSEDLLQDLTDYYRATIPNVAYRLLTPSSVRVDQSYLDSLVREYQTLALHFIDGKCGDSNRRPKQVRKRGKQRLKSVNEDENNKTNVESLDVRGKTRHLSVSSDVSVHSEEDNITAVVEEVNKQIELEEKRSMKQASKLEKSSRRRNEKPLTFGPTQPEDVPSWTPKMRTLCWGIASNNSTNNLNDINEIETSPNMMIPSALPGPSKDPTSMSSPVSPSISTSVSLIATGPTRLRDIMEQESKTSTGNSHPGRKQSFPSHFPRKESKKHLKRDDLEDKNAAQVPKSPVCPWGSVSAVVSGVVSSFRDLMLQDKGPQEEGAVSPKTHSKSSSSPGTTRSSKRVLMSRRSIPISIPLSLPPDQATSPSAENPWLRRSESAGLMSSSTSPPSAVNFSHILQDEMEKEEVLIKMKRKPLALIQLEERAMQELLQHYRASTRVDEYVTVERVSKNVAAVPIWHRERPSTGSF